MKMHLDNYHDGHGEVSIINYQTIKNGSEEVKYQVNDNDNEIFRLNKCNLGGTKIKLNFDEVGDDDINTNKTVEPAVKHVSRNLNIITNKTIELAHSCTKVSIDIDIVTNNTIETSHNKKVTINLTIEPDHSCTKVSIDLDIVTNYIIEPAHNKQVSINLDIANNNTIEPAHESTKVSIHITNNTLKQQ